MLTDEDEWDSREREFVCEHPHPDEQGWRTSRPGGPIDVAGKPSGETLKRPGVFC